MARRRSADVIAGTKTEVYFDSPLVQDMVVPSRPLSPTADFEPSMEEITQCVKDCLDEGFDERAVVVKRSFPWKANNPMYWGVVTDVNKWKPAFGPYAPLSVRWLNGDSVTKHYAEELWLIHAAIAPAHISALLQRQELS